MRTPAISPWGAARPSLAGAELATSHTSVVERWTQSRGPSSPAPLRVSRTDDRRIFEHSLDNRPWERSASTFGQTARMLLLVVRLGQASRSCCKRGFSVWRPPDSPQRVTFLLVDYKGGSAFRECTNLPHTLGLVTDLSPHLVRRALISLSAELRYREHLLATYKAKDLLELERRGK